MIQIIGKSNGDAVFSVAVAERRDFMPFLYSEWRTDHLKLAVEDTRRAWRKTVNAGGCYGNFKALPAVTCIGTRLLDSADSMIALPSTRRIATFVKLVESKTAVEFSPMRKNEPGVSSNSTWPRA